MRVRINGEITVERLVEALVTASEKLEEVRPGCKIYGANLYLTAFDADGVPFDLVDHRGESLIITLATPSGQLVRPALTAEGQARKDMRRAEVERRRIEEEEKDRALRAEQERRYEERRASAQAVMERYELLNNRTEQLMQASPEDFVQTLNNIVQAVWQELSPVEPSGKKKGQPRPQPTYQAGGDGLSVSVSTRKSPLQIQNPVILYKRGSMVPIWSNDAWTEVASRVLEFMFEGCAPVDSEVPLDDNGVKPDDTGYTDLE